MLVTLVYLAVQVRQGVSAGQRESLRGYVSQLNSNLLEPQRDPEFVEIFQQANRDWHSISSRDQAVVSSVYSSYFFACAEAFAVRARSDVDPALQYQADQAVASFLQMPGPAAWWEQGASYYPESFRNHVDQMLASDERPPPMHHLLPWYVGDASDTQKTT